jgi:murein DD-endopeptidase MepM/ murein hydrolase activator NlpD
LLSVLALQIGFNQFGDVQVKIQALTVLSYEYSLRQGAVLEEATQAQDIDFRATEDIDFEYEHVISDPAVMQKNLEEFESDFNQTSTIVSSSSDDDFVMLSPEEEAILAKTKFELARYQKKIAQQRLVKRSQSKNYNSQHSKNNQTKKNKIAHQKTKIIEKSSRIPTMNHIKRKRVENSFFDWPVDLSLFWLSSVYGPRSHPRGGKRFHYGIDLAALKGTPVMAAATGQVIQAGFVKGYGNNIIIKHNHQYKTRYAHLHKIYVKEGQLVLQGEKIASVGATGYVRKSGRDGSHLHFEIYSNGVHVNPLKYLLNE